jgi:tRNA modification GTPase
VVVERRSFASVLPPDDTIVAIATPLGRSAIGVVRISGQAALEIAHALLGVALRPRQATICRVAVEGVSGRAVGGDEAVAVFFPGPRSYTGEDVVEISTHGNPLILTGVVQRAIAAGARLARRGEFTLRSVINGKRSLVEAEAIADVIDASTPAQARLAFDQLHGTLSARLAAIDAELFDLIAKLEASLDFPDEGYHFLEDGEAAAVLTRVLGAIDMLLGDAARGRLLREGATVAIIGRANVGKSSLFNALAGGDRAIVSETPGTTRDLVTERVDVRGLCVTLVDTAGTREPTDPVEREGVRRAARARETADLVLLVLDASTGQTGHDEALLRETSAARRVVVWNKSDLVENESVTTCVAGVLASATRGSGLDDVRGAIARALLDREPEAEAPAIANVRHITELGGVRDALVRARGLVNDRAPEEFVLRDLHTARARFDELFGARTSADVLERIFDRFCIGK